MAFALEIFAAPIICLLRSRPQSVVGIGSSAELLDWARTEFWHGNEEKPVFGGKNQWADQENSGIFPRWGVNAREELLIRLERAHCAVYTRGAQCGCVTAGNGGKAGTESKCARARMALCGVCVVELALGQPAAEPPPTGGENDTNPPVGRGGTLRTLQGCYKTEQIKFEFL